MVNWDYTSIFYKEYLSKYCDKIDTENDYVVTSSEDNELFLAFRYSDYIEGMEKEDFENYRDAVFFYEAIGLLSWNDEVQSYVVNTGKLASKKTEYTEYNESPKMVKIPVKRCC